MNRAGRWSLWIWLFLIAVVAAGVFWSGRTWWNGRWSQRVLDESRKDMASGRPGRAAQKLRQLLSWQPHADEAAYMLGNCEQARGQFPAAIEAWSRVTPGSSFATPAIQARMELELARGRLADAEQRVLQALDDPRNEGSGIALVLGLLYARQGRLQEARRSLETTWERMSAAGQANWERAIPLARLHIHLRLDPPPAEAIRAFLDQAARRAPDDDRVLLGLANLAIQTGKYDEAKRLLDTCLKRRPDDLPVCNARLRWGVATRKIDAVIKAAEHLPFDDWLPAQVHRLAAWLSATRGDLDGEKHALKRVLENDPTDVTAWDRLIELAQNQQSDEASESRKNKEAIERLQTRYRSLDRRNQPFRDAEEMARLAEKLGQPFEALVFLTIASAANPERMELKTERARLMQERRARKRPGETLAEFLAFKIEASRAGDPVNFSNQR